METAKEIIPNEFGKHITNSKQYTWQMSLVNPEGNTCYFKYSLEIADTDEILYESDLIEPGKAITEFQVQKTLEQGDYTLYINVNTYTMDGSLSPLNGAQVKMTLHIV